MCSNFGIWSYVFPYICIYLSKIDTEIQGKGNSAVFINFLMNPFTMLVLFVFVNFLRSLCHIAAKSVILAVKIRASLTRITCIFARNYRNSTFGELSFDRGTSMAGQAG